jgi:DUF4097 and DUF4098 domain-containing protein YvlB
MIMRPVTIVCLLASAALAQADDYPFSEPFHFTGPLDAGATVAVENVNGRITIQTWDRNEVLIEGTKHAKTEEELKLLELDTDLTPAHASLIVRHHKRSSGWFGGNSARGRVDITVTVPATVELRDIKSVNGAVAIDGVRGAINVSLVNGSCDATGLAASARVHTVNGETRVSFVEVPTKARLEFHTVNGGINVGLPANAGLAVDCSTVNGGINSDLPLTVQGSFGRRHLEGTIGDGRASLELRSVNGGIHLSSL